MNQTKLRRIGKIVLLVVLVLCLLGGATVLGINGYVVSTASD